MEPEGEGAVTLRMFSRFDVVECTVVGHRHFGILVEADDGTPGFIDKAEVSDDYVDSTGWPLVGSRIRCVVLGHSHDGRIRVTSAPAHVELVNSLDDPQQALREWSSLKESHGAEVVASFYRSPNARALIAWGLKGVSGSSNRTLALELLAGAPESLRDALGFPGSE